MRKEQADKNNQQTVLTSKPIQSTAAQTTQRSSITTQDMELQTCAQNAEKQKNDTNRHLNTQQAEGMKQVLILGDSVTKGLRKDKMSTNTTTVDIKSHRGATV
jgi:hypothetical protein